MSTIFDTEGTNPPDAFTPLIQQALQVTSPNDTPNNASHSKIAANLINIVTTSPKLSTALWNLWDALFKSVATSATTNPSSHLNLLAAIRAHPPTEPTNAAARPGTTEATKLRHSTYADDGKLHWSSLPAFGAQWRDVHDILEAWRDWDGVREDNSTTTNPPEKTAIHAPDKYFLRFVEFSAALLRETNGEVGVSPIWVFYACKNALERQEGPRGSESGEHRIAPEKVWALDVRVTATWVRDGARVLWETDWEEMRRDCKAALEEETELWPRGDGLRRERWRLWAERLKELGGDGRLDEETKGVVREAAGVVEGLLEGK